MADAATYIGVVPRTIQLTNAAIGRGLRVVRGSDGTCTLAAATVRGDYVTMVDGAISEYISAASLSGGGKVGAYASEAVNAGDLAYAAANGQFSKTSTNAALLGRWTTTTAVNTLGEVEILDVQ